MSTLKDIQKMLGCTADGILGPKTAAALEAAHFDIVIDAGHTADFKREHPSQFASGLWEHGVGQRIADRLGFTTATNDSVEHMLTTDVAEHTLDAARAMGLKVLYFDDPAMDNDPEFSLAAKIAAAAKPRVFLSLHANASGSPAWKTLGSTAEGHMVYFLGEPSRNIACRIFRELSDLRTATGGGDNRANPRVQVSDFAVLRRSAGAHARVLVELGFYDNARDLAWMADNSVLIGRALARACFS